MGASSSRAIGSRRGTRRHFSSSTRSTGRRRHSLRHHPGSPSAAGMLFTPRHGRRRPANHAAQRGRSRAVPGSPCRERGRGRSARARQPFSARSRGQQSSPSRPAVFSGTRCPPIRSSTPGSPSSSASEGVAAQAFAARSTTSLLRVSRQEPCPGEVQARIPVVALVERRADVGVARDPPAARDETRRHGCVESGSHAVCTPSAVSLAACSTTARL